MAGKLGDQRRNFVEKRKVIQLVLPSFHDRTFKTDLCKDWAKLPLFILDIVNIVFKSF